MGQISCVDLTINSLATTLTFTPVEAISLNESFSIQVLIDEIKNLAGWSFNLEYDPKIFSFESVEEGDVLKIYNGTIFFQKGTVNKTVGTVTGISSTYLGTGGVSSSGSLLTINLKSIKGEEGYFRLKETKFGDYKSNEITIQSIHQLPFLLVEIGRNLVRGLEKCWLRPIEYHRMC